MQPRTKRQKEVLDYVTKFIDRNGHKPSYQQIARHLGLSSRAGIQRHIAALESQGLIARRRENGSFGIDLELRRFVTDKVCEVEVFEVIGDQRPWTVSSRTAAVIPRYLIGELPPTEVFALRIPDDSMSGRQVCEGDLVFFARRSYARRGEVVAARLENGHMLVGLYYQHGPETEIRPADEDHDPMVLPADEVAVEGVMRGLIRFSAISEE